MSLINLIKNLNINIGNQLKLPLRFLIFETLGNFFQAQIKKIIKILSLIISIITLLLLMYFGKLVLIM